MDSAGQVLLAGETWFSYGVHQKGFAAYTTGEYAQGCDRFVSALRSTGWVIDHISNHDATSTFPTTQSQFDNWDVVVLSDIAPTRCCLPGKRSMLVNAARTGFGNSTNGWLPAVAF